MSDEEKFFEILANSLIEIRTQAYKNDDNVSFHICDVLHNAPAIILRNIRAGEPHGYSEALGLIKSKAEAMGISKFFGEIH